MRSCPRKVEVFKLVAAYSLACACLASTACQQLKEVGADGSRLYASNEDAGTASVIDLKTGRTLATFVVGTEPEGCRVSPDGRWVVTAGPSSAGLWNVRSRSLLFYLRGDSDLLTSASFSPDGRTILTSSRDGTVRTYRCDLCGGLDELLALARRELARTNRDLTPDERRRYLHD